MTDEEFQRIKEAEKERLRARKKLRQLKATQSQKAKIRDAFRRVKEGAETLLQRSSDLIDELTRETVREEARLEVALDSQADETTDEEAASLEEEDREARAEALVRQLKMMAVTRTSSGEKASPRSSDETAETDASSEDELPEKTIGRMRK